MKESDLQDKQSVKNKEEAKDSGQKSLAIECKEKYSESQKHDEADTPGFKQHSSNSRTLKS